MEVKIPEIPNTPEQIVAHLGDDYERFEGAVVPPIFGNSLFVHPTFESFLQAMGDEHNHFLYSRGQNPTVDIVERKIAALEGGERCKLFASGMAAISSGILANVSAGDHVLCVGNIYGPTQKFLAYLDKFQVQYSMVVTADLNEVERALLPNTRVIYLESPSTMTFQIADMAAIVQLAKARGIVTMIDNTWATPLFQHPLEIGIDIVLHSASKYLGGHSDLIGGALIASSEMMERIFYREYQLLGGIMPPYEAWLLMRGLRTLPIRMKAHQSSALKIAKMLEDMPGVVQVNHPGLPSHPQYELGRRQLKGYSGLFSFNLKNNRFEHVARVINRFKLFRIGVSWGGYESLVLSPNHGHNVEQLVRSGIDPGCIRIAVGLEDADALMEDVAQALNM